MGDESNLTPIQSAWLGFTNSVRLLLVPRIDDRPLDQYLQFRNDVLALVQGPGFLQDLQTSWTGMDTANTPLKQVGDLLLVELRAFPLAIEVHQAMEKAESGEKGGSQKWLSRASTVTSSVKDLLEQAPTLVKYGLTLLRELLDLFKRN